MPSTNQTDNAAREAGQSILTGGFIEAEILSDGSRVYNVHIPDQTINCVDERSAITLVSALSKAIREATGEITPSEVSASYMSIETLLLEAKGDISNPFTPCVFADYDVHKASATNGMLNRLAGWLHCFGVSCFVERSCLHIPVASGGYYAVGDANENWEMDYYDCDADLGDDPQFTHVIPISSDNKSNGWGLAAHICAQMIVYNMSMSAREYAREAERRGLATTAFAALHNLGDANMILPGAHAFDANNEQLCSFHDAVMRAVNVILRKEAHPR